LTSENGKSTEATGGMDLNDFSILSQNLIVCFSPTDASQASWLPGDFKAGDLLIQCYGLATAVSDWSGNAAYSKPSAILPCSLGYRHFF